MKLRHRLIAFSSFQLLVFGALFAIAYWTFRDDVLPAFEASLLDKTARATHAMARELDVPLGADDPALLAKTLEPITRDPDVRAVVVKDAAGEIVFAHGPVGSDAFGGDAGVARIEGDAITAWSVVQLEGLVLGSVSVKASTARVDGFATWATRFAVLVSVLWLLALAYSLSFARSFVEPIGAMTAFSRRVAEGELAKPLDVDAPGELRGLRDDLNEMAGELRRREMARDHAAKQAAELQKEMLAISRSAGMTEVATSVLHNVGNVLNTINTSAALVDQRLRNSRIPALGQLVDMAANHPSGLRGLAASDKGTLVESYLATLAVQLAEDNAAALGELDSLVHNIEHVKTIIAAQQGLGRVSDMSERVELPEVVNDALQMSDMVSARHGIELIKEFAETPPIETDRHKLLQILINLLSNARHALVDSARPERRLAIRLRTAPRGVTIEVSDNGVGIPPENLDKIFRHGFTTKANGHGFGLHASAITTQELGGTIAVASEGAGRGASFTVELPLRIQRKAHDSRN